MAAASPLTGRDGRCVLDLSSLCLRGADSTRDSDDAGLSRRQVLHIPHVVRTDAGCHRRATTAHADIGQADGQGVGEHHAGDGLGIVIGELERVGDHLAGMDEPEGSGDALGNFRAFDCFYNCRRGVFSKVFLPARFRRGGGG